MSSKPTLLILLAASLMLAACGDDGNSANTGPDGFNDPDPMPDAMPDGTPDPMPGMEPEHVCPDFEGERPASRSEMVGVFDTKRQNIVFFGGDDGVPVQCSAAPHPIGELWVYDARCAVFTRQAINNGPGGRARGVAVHDTIGDRMLVFGGRFREARSGPYTLYNEVWAVDLETFEWELLQTTGGGPDARVNTVAAFNKNKNEMVIYGGNASNNGAFFDPRGDAWILDMATLTWRELTTSATRPVARLFHAAALDDDNNILYVFGGGDENAFFGPFFGDMWSLNVTTGVWTELHPGGNQPNAPDPRIWATMVYDKVQGRVILFGGHDDGAVGNQNDTWAFDPDAKTWTMLTPPETVETPANGFCDFPPDFTIPNIDAPDRRSSHLLALDDVRGEMLVFGGKTDCGIIDDVWTFDLQREAWLELKAPTEGEACTRSDNPDQCVAMCQ